MFLLQNMDDVDVRYCNERVLQNIMAEAIFRGDLQLFNNCVYNGNRIYDITLQVPWEAAVLRKNYTAIYTLLTIVPYLTNKEALADVAKIAVDLNDEEIIKTLIDLKIPLEGQGIYKYSILHRVIMVNATSILKKMLFDNININATDATGNTALLTTVKNNNYFIAQKLLENGANPDIENKIGETPLLVASMGSTIFDLLLHFGANVNHQDHAQIAPLHVVCMKNYANVLFAQKLLQCNIDVDIRNKWEETPLHIAAKSGKVEIIEELVKAGADIEAEDADGYTPLMLALEDGAEKVVKSFLTLNPCINRQTRKGKTVLDLALESKNTNILIMTLKAGANITDWDYQGYTFLHGDVILKPSASAIAKHLISNNIIYNGMLTEIKIGNPYLHDVYMELRNMKNTLFMNKKTYFDVLTEPFSIFVEFIKRPNDLASRLNELSKFPMHRAEIMLKYELAKKSILSRRLKKHLSKRVSKH